MAEGGRMKGRKRGMVGMHKRKIRREETSKDGGEHKRIEGERKRRNNEKYLAEG
jgi:hypothetical protein